MILRKPYAFLIKNFRVIHIALTLLLAYASIRLGKVVTFFNNYVKSGYFTSITQGLRRMYTPITLFLLIFLIIALLVSMLILMVHKKKPYLLYLLMVIYYSVIFFGMFYISVVLDSFSDILLASTVARSIRDTLLIISIPQYIFIILTGIRAIGFDVKKFDFGSDLKELEMSHSDAEEFELNINFEGYKAKQKTNRILREFVYYIKENKFFVIIISTIAAIILGVVIYNNVHFNKDSKYRMGKAFTYEKLNITFEDAIATNLDYNGNLIDDTYYYLVIKTNVKNNSGHSVKVDYNNFKLEVGNDTLLPIVNYAKYFIDYAPSNVPYSFSHRSEYTFGLVYKIKKSQITKTKTMKIFTGTVYDKGEYVEKHIVLNINSKKVRDLQIVGNYEIGNKISFDDTYLGKSSLTFNQYYIGKKYIYDINNCSNEEDCKTYNDIITSSNAKNTLIVLNVGFEQDKDVIFNKTYSKIKDFTDNFVKIQYRTDGQIYSTNSINVTPLNATDFMAFEVPDNISEADIIQVIIIVRNREYIVNIYAK